MAQVRTITREDLKAKTDRGEDLVLLEVLEGFISPGHLPEAIRAQDQNAAVEVVPHKSAFVVVYCSNYNRHASTRVARALAAKGYENVYDHEGGKQDWIEAGLPTESR